VKFIAKFCGEGIVWLSLSHFLHLRILSFEIEIC
jgi:hypothetical protein